MREIVRPVVKVGDVVIHLRVELPAGVASQKSVVPIEVGRDGSLRAEVVDAALGLLEGCLREINDDKP
jgi:hypothetical protein